VTEAAAHDIKNLLAVIAGGLRLLECRGDLQGCEPILERMRHAIAGGVALSGRLLDATPPEAPSPGAYVTYGHLATLGRTLDGAWRGDVVVETEIDPDLEIFHADAEGLYFALLNLCRNAGDAMPRGGNVLISARNIDPLPGAPRGLVELTVADNGEGMAQDLLARALEPHFTTKKPGKGTGLGLAQVQRFVERHGGAIRVESELGLGTLVRMVFPRVVSD
jgi:signal transduction histidine kinase